MESTQEIFGPFFDMGVLQGTSTVRVKLETLRVVIYDSDEDADESISYPEVTLPRLRVVESKRVPLIPPIFLRSCPSLEYTAVPYPACAPSSGNPIAP